MKMQFAYSGCSLIPRKSRICDIVSCVVDRIILSLIANHTVVTNAFFHIILCHKRYEATAICMFFKCHLCQIRLGAFCRCIADMVCIVLVAGTALHHILPSVHL